MSEFVSQFLLIFVLAGIMLGMGLGLTLNDFKQVFIQPKTVFIGLILQACFLPALAIGIIILLPLSPMASAGLFLVALCPGGATSNLFSYLAQGDVALSVTLTSIISLLSVVTLPLGFVAYLSITGNEMSFFSVPLGTIIKQLALVTVFPIVIGMVIRAYAPQWSQKTQPLIKKFSTLAMIAIVLALLATNMKILSSLINLNALAILLLASVSLGFSYWFTGTLNLPKKAQRTIAVEVGVQNAGTAMMVAFAILHQPDLAVVPLMYGLLMNIPAFAFVSWSQKQQEKTNRVTV